jgi:hypothetical protein
MRTQTKSPYYDTILEKLARFGHVGMDPRHVEGYMRIEHGTLDGLTRSQFDAEVKGCAELVLSDISGAESLAVSYGL